MFALSIVTAIAAAPAGAHFSSRKAIWGPAIQGGVSEWPTYHKLGVGIYEDYLDWFAIAPRRPRDPQNPSDPAYHWPVAITDAVAAAKRYHIRVDLDLYGTPGWANHDRSYQWAPTDVRDYANFAIAAARRYPSVHLWMIWAEATRAGDFDPSANPHWYQNKLTPAEARGPHKYAEMLNAAYFALKSVSRANLVIGGMSFTGGNYKPKQWIENLVLPDGKPPHLDMYGHNPMSDREPNLANPPSIDGYADFSDLGRLAGWVDHYLGRGRRIPLFLSEWTIPTAPDFEFPFWVDAPVAAKWITAAFSIVHHWRQIYALGWIELQDSAPGPQAVTGGLLYANGRPKPGFFAFQNG